MGRMDKLCSGCQAGVPHDCSGTNDRPPKRKEKKKRCNRCRTRTVHVYDNGKQMFICTECELNENEN